MSLSSPMMPRAWASKTGLSDETCSDGASFRLYAAHTISRDFLSVSSILQAVNSAAAAASCVVWLGSRRYKANGKKGHGTM